MPKKEQAPSLAERVATLEERVAYLERRGRTEFKPHPGSRMAYWDEYFKQKNVREAAQMLSNGNPQEPDLFRSGAGGKRTAAHLMIDEFKRRAAEGSALATLEKEAEYLEGFIRNEYPKAPPLKAKRIRELIRADHRVYRSAAGATKKSPIHSQSSRESGS